MKAPLPVNEKERLTALRGYGILDTLPELAYDRVTRLASRLFGAPIALISLLDEHRQWFKSTYGIDVRETSRDLAFCGYAILGSDVMCVPNARDDFRFRDNALVTGDPHIRFYAGAPLEDPAGWKLGTLCVIDYVPRAPLTAEENATLEDLAAIVMAELQLRTALQSLSAVNEKLTRLAGTDPLTLVPNRLAFELEFERRLTSSPDQHLTVMYLDLDGFKTVNDGPGGHAAGDALLTILARMLADCLPAGAMLARMGGDEFVALVSGLSRQEMEHLAEKMCQCLDRAVTLSDGTTHRCGISIGIACYPQNGTSAGELVRRADQAMYLSKQGGGSCYRICGETAGGVVSAGVN